MRWRAAIAPWRNRWQAPCCHQKDASPKEKKPCIFLTTTCLRFAYLKMKSLWLKIRQKWPAFISVCKIAIWVRALVFVVFEWMLMWRD